MAGAYSPNAIRAAEQLANTLRDQGKEPVMYVVGRKGDSYYRFRDRAPHRSWTDRKSTRLNSSHVAISYAVFCLKKKKKRTRKEIDTTRTNPTRKDSRHDHNT